jgi:hypothetical protein
MAGISPSTWGAEKIGFRPRIGVKKTDESYRSNCRHFVFDCGHQAIEYQQEKDKHNPTGQSSLPDADTKYAKAQCNRSNSRYTSSEDASRDGFVYKVQPIVVILDPVLCQRKSPALVIPYRRGLLWTDECQNNHSDEQSEADQSFPATTPIHDAPLAYVRVLITL